MYRSGTKRTEKKRIEENVNVSFFRTDNQACSGRAIRSVIRELLNFGLSRSMVTLDRVWVRS